MHRTDIFAIAQLSCYFCRAAVRAVIALSVRPVSLLPLMLYCMLSIMEDIGLKKEKNEQEELTPRSIHSSRLEKRSLRLHSMRLRGAGPIAYTGRSFW